MIFNILNPLNLFGLSPSPQKEAIELLVKLPDGTRFVAQDGDGSWWAFDARPLYQSDEDAWFPPTEEGLSAQLCWGLPPFAPTTTLREVGVA